MMDSTISVTERWSRRHLFFLGKDILYSYTSALLTLGILKPNCQIALVLRTCLIIKTIGYFHRDICIHKKKIGALHSSIPCLLLIQLRN